MLRVTVLSVGFLFALLLAAAAVVFPAARPVQAQTPCSWTGTWLPFEGEVRLVQSGSAVSGSYLDGKGLIRGTVSGNVLRGEWSEAPSYSPPFEAGHLILTMGDDCSFYNGTAGLGEANCCLEFGASRAGDPPPSLAVQVVRPSLKVDGQPILPGETYFPKTCAPAGAAPREDDCSTLLNLTQEGRLQFHCFAERLAVAAVVIDRLQLDKEDVELLMDALIVQFQQACGITAARQGIESLELGVQKGSANFTNQSGGRVSVRTSAATAVLESPGSFVASYKPGTGRATFQAHAAALTIQPLNGSPFTLPPHSQVQVTAEGVGPVTPLPRIYLPMQSR